MERIRGRFKVVASTMGLLTDYFPREKDVDPGSLPEGPEGAEAAGAVVGGGAAAGRQAGAGSSPLAAAAAAAAAGGGDLSF